MGRRFIIGDVHCGHKNINSFRHWVNPVTGERYSSEDQHEMMFEGLAKIHKRDHLFLMGDICFTKEWLERIKTLQCETHFITGNHDTTKQISMRDLVEAYDKVYALRSYKGTWLSHAPIHPVELRGKINVHAHVHNQLVLTPGGFPDNRYVCVSADYLPDFAPISWEFATSIEYYKHCCNKFDEYVKLGLTGDRYEES